MKNYRLYLAIGMLSLVFGLVIRRFVPADISFWGMKDFLSGMLIGISIPCNIAAIIFMKRGHNDDSQK